jgi:hypothetical protein
MLRRLVGADANKSKSDSAAFTVQNLQYIRNNAAQAGFVEKLKDYLYSSAKTYNNKQPLLLQIEVI